jgi:hypothetical protein
MRRLVEHQNPEGRETPMLLLADLRQIDATMEIVYAGERVWWVGRVTRNDVREERGRLMLGQLEALDDYLKDRPSVARSILYGKLLIQGFARIEMYTDCGDPSWTVQVEWFNGHRSEWYHTTILDDIRERCQAFERDGGEAAFQRRLRETDGTATKEASDANIKEYLVNDGLAHYRREVRNRVTFGYGGMTGGAGRTLVTP